MYEFSIWRDASDGSSQFGNCFDFAEDILGECLDRHAGARGLGDEMPCVNCIETGEVVHVAEKANGLDDLFDGGSGSYEHCLEILADLFGLPFDVCSDNGSGGRI